jgi:hypothetical protein
MGAVSSRHGSSSAIARRCVAYSPSVRPPCLLSGHGRLGDSLSSPYAGTRCDRPPLKQPLGALEPNAETQKSPIEPHSP